VESSRVRRAGGALLAVLGVVLLISLVALASRPEHAGGTAPLGADPAHVVLDVATYLFVVLVLLGLLVIVWALWPRADEELPPLPPRRHWALSTVLATVMAVGIAVWLRSGHANRLPGVNAGAPGRALPLSGLPGPVRTAASGGFDWLAAAIVGVVLAAGAALVWWLLRPRRRLSGRQALVRLQAVLDDAIEDVLGEADPRKAVIAAWARLERVLARHGVPRRESEAPFEYADRAGAAIGVEAVSLERLADLFEWARFSLHEVTPAMRQEALDGLLNVRDGLRLAT
jgi:cbb3-type cytochrome oxidase subunit 3